MDKKPLSDFKKFVVKEISPAIADIESLKEKNRVHVQKLVYRNVVDRFDTMIDVAILLNCKEEHLLHEAFKDMDHPITESELVKLLMHGDGLQSALYEKLKNTLRSSILNERHSKKLASLFKVFPSDGDCWSKPRVNISTGAIRKQFKPQNKTHPCSLCGYADWLYSRRNSLVHGTGTSKFLDNDVKQLKKLFKCTPTKTFRIELSSVKNTIKFYDDLVEIMLA